MNQITVTIDEDGNTTVEAQGMVGSGCAALTAALERELGRTIDDRKTRDYYAAQPQNQPAKR